MLLYQVCDVIVHVFYSPYFTLLSPVAVAFVATIGLPHRDGTQPLFINKIRFLCPDALIACLTQLCYNPTWN